MQSDLSGAQSPPGLALRNIRKSFGKTSVLQGVDLHVKKGEFLTLLGPSGCGKTTLLRIIAGLEATDTGSVVLDGQDMTYMPANRRPVNTVFQSYALFPHLSVAENVAFGLVARGVDKQTIKSKVGAAMEMVKIGEFAARYPAQLSGGQKQRVALARALVNEPAVLLLDEPMSALDARLRTQVQVELRRLQRRLGTMFVLVTHDQDEAMAVSDRIVVMNGGLIEQQGVPREVFDKPATRFVAEFLGAANLTAGTRVDAHKVNTGWGELVCTPPADWAAGYVGVRPERVVIRPEAAAGEAQINTRKLTVKEGMDRAGRQELFFEETEISALWSGAPMKPGEKVMLTLPPEWVFFVPKEKGGAA